MKTALSDLISPTSMWRLLHKIDDVLGQMLSFEARLGDTAGILIDTLDVDAIWFVTIKPLPPFAIGRVRTPLTIAPDAKISIVDNNPPIADGWSATKSHLGQVISCNTPFFSGVNGTQNDQFDSDLGDALFSTFNTTPLAIIPLVADEVSLGALVLGNQSQPPVQFSDNAQDFLVYLGKHIAKNLQNTDLVASSVRHAETLITLNQIAQTITSTLDIDDVIRKTMAGINRLLDVEAGSLLLIDEETGELYFKITLRGENKQVASHRLRSDEGIVGWVITNNKPAIVNNPATDKRFFSKIDHSTGFTTENILCVPLIVQGKPIGVLELLNKRSGLFDEDDQELLVSMAAVLGVALNNAMLYEESQERVHIKEIISQMTAVINAGHGLSETAKIVFKQFRRLFSFDHISISLLDDSKEKIRQWIFYEHGSIEHTKQHIPLEGSELAQIIEQGQGHVIQNISQPTPEGKIHPDNEIFRLDNIKSKVVVPLVAQETPYGSLSLGSREVETYGLRELKLLEQLTPQLAITIDKALLIDTMERRTTELQLLNHLGEMLVSTTDLEIIVDTTLNMLPRLLPGDVHGVVIAGDEGAHVGVAVPFSFNKTIRITKEIFDIFIELNDSYESLEIISSKSVAGNMPVPVEWEPVTVMSLPILTPQGAQGIIYLASGQNEDFSDNVIRIFALIVSQISATIANAHLFQQVEQERARLEAILASITDAVLVVNRKGRIVLDNPAAREILSATESQSGRLLAESTNLNTLIELFDSAIQGNNLTGEILLDDGRTFFTSLSPVHIGEANVIGWVATMQDVSHFKELDELKNDFVSSVSHDLRSPLSTILLAVNLVGETGELNKDQQELIAAVDKHVRAMGDLIDDILDVGKIEAGIDMEMEPCNLTSIIETVTEILKPQAIDKTIDLSSQLDKDLPLVMANTTRMHQVIHNLVGNAIKYTPNEGKVVVKAYPKDGEMRVQVIDTGMGIPTSDQSHIFEKFYRVQNDQAVKIKGTGLGLAITKGIIEKHHGRIWLESVFGEGTTFTIALPLQPENNP